MLFTAEFFFNVYLATCDFCPFLLFLRCFAYFRLCHAVCRILVPRPGIEPGPPALGAWSLNHWTTREVVTTQILHHSPSGIFSQPSYPILITLSSAVLKPKHLWFPNPQSSGLHTCLCPGIHSAQEESPVSFKVCPKCPWEAVPALAHKRPRGRTTSQLRHSIPQACSSAIGFTGQKSLAGYSPRDHKGRTRLGDWNTTTTAAYVYLLVEPSWLGVRTLIFPSLYLRSWQATRESIVLSLSDRFKGQMQKKH